MEIYSLAMLCNVANLQVHPLDASYLRSYSIEACILQPECFKVVTYCPAGHGRYPQLGMVPGFGLPQGIPIAIAPTIAPTIPITIPSEIRKSIPKVTKSHKKGT